MVRVTVNYNKGFDIVPNEQPKPNYEAFVTETSLAAFIDSLDTEGIQTIQIKYNVDMLKDIDSNNE